MIGIAADAGAGRPVGGDPEVAGDEIDSSNAMSPRRRDWPALSDVVVRRRPVERGAAEQGRHREGAALPTRGSEIAPAGSRTICASSCRIACARRTLRLRRAAQGAVRDTPRPRDDIDSPMFQPLPRWLDEVVGRLVIAERLREHQRRSADHAGAGRDMELDRIGPPTRAGDGRVAPAKASDLIRSFVTPMVMMMLDVPDRHLDRVPSSTA